MKSLKALLLTVFALVPVSAFAASLGHMRVSYLVGEVLVKTLEAGEWGLVWSNSPLAEGDQIWVPEGGKVELQLDTGTYVRLDGSSALHVLSLDRDSAQFYLSQGRSYVSFDGPEGGVLQLDAPHVSSRVGSRAVFRVEAADAATRVYVYKGYVETENDAGKGRVNAGEMLAATETGEILSPLGSPDEWAGWNKDRDGRVAEIDGAAAYLPPELSPFADELEENGRWVTVHEYGNVWSPSEALSPGWVPYRHGRWIWRGGEYVWLGYEPWGWAPYHYGRWAFVPRLGWCWVPPPHGEVYWSPGYVSWVRTPEYVAWVPLAPGETYYGRGHYGSHSVNVARSTVTRVRPRAVSRNVQVADAVTVVDRASFRRGSPRLVHVSKQVVVQKIFVRENLRGRGPGVTPQMGALVQRPGSPGPDRQPPELVRRMDVRELRQSRPFVRVPRASGQGRGPEAIGVQSEPPRGPRGDGPERGGSGLAAAPSVLGRERLPARREPAPPPQLHGGKGSDRGSSDRGGAQPGSGRSGGSPRPEALDQGRERFRETPEVRREPHGGRGSGREVQRHEGARQVERAPARDQRGREPDDREAAKQKDRGGENRGRGGSHRRGG
ncbi:MAG: FecR domain-containing protein [Deltaproteobacteria bacterium]|nr:FecR domain-containing protein [Deltaproteobacteria bacterium]